MKFDKSHEYYVVKGWFEKNNGLNGNSFYGAVATPDNYLKPKRITMTGEDAALAAEAASKQPAKIYPNEITEWAEPHDGPYGDALNPVQRADTQKLILDQDVEHADEEARVKKDVEALGGKFEGTQRDDDGSFMWFNATEPTTGSTLVISPGDNVAAKFEAKKIEFAAKSRTRMEMTGTGAVAIMPSALGMPDRGGHGRVDNLGPKRTKTGNNRVPKSLSSMKGLKGFRGKGKVPTISQSAGRLGGRA